MRVRVRYEQNKSGRVFCGYFGDLEPFYGFLMRSFIRAILSRDLNKYGGVL